jgi:glycosyltransferase involved in cell wall biosynthesis
MVLFVDQSPGPLIVDIVNSINSQGQQVKLFYGFAKIGNKKFNPGIRLSHAMPYRRETFFLRILTWWVFCVQYFFYLIFCEKPSVIVAVTNPPFITFITSFIATKRRIPFCLLIYDLYPEALLHAELGRPDSFVVDIWKRLNRYFFKKAEIVFTISNTMKTQISKYCAVDDIQVIHNWADTDYIQPFRKDSNILVKQFELENKKVVLYAGNCGLTHDLESLVEAANLLASQRNIFFIIAGEGAKKQKLQNMARAFGLQNILFLPYQNETVFPQLMACADIGIVTLGVAAEAISVPSKTYTNLAAGLCLVAIAPPDSELGEIILKYEVGALCPPKDPLTLSETIKKVFTNDELLNKYKLNSRKAVANFTRRNADLYSEYLKVFF